MNQKEAVFAVVQTLVFVGVLALVALPSVAPGSSSTYTQPPPSVCDGQVSVSPDSLAPVRNETRLANGTTVNDTLYPAFFLRPNTRGTICVTYFDNISKTTLSLTQGRNYLTGTFGTQGIVPLRGGQLNMTSDPSAISLEPRVGQTVAYTLTAGSTSGLYQAMFPPADCVGSPIFVGAASQVNATAYYQLSVIENWSCTALGGNISVGSIGLVNITLAYVGRPP